MRQNIGALVSVLAMIGLLVHTQSPPAAENATFKKPAGTEGKKSKAAQKAEQPEPPDESEPPEGPWVATRAFFPPTSEKYDSGQLSQLHLVSAVGDSAGLQRFLGLPDAASENSVEMWSIVATVADPLHTRLSLFLDSQLVSIERAFQAAGWDFAGQWLPWMDRLDATETDISARRKQRRLQRQQEVFPGILIFRPAPLEQPARETQAAVPSHFPDRVLFVLLVPETPTTGISGPAFFAAMNIAKAAVRASKKKGQEIGLLAPSFTGSFSSLTHLLMDWERANPSGIVQKKVYGGSISGGRYAHAFENSTKHEFHSGIVDSEGYLCAFEEVLSRYGIKKDQAAFLRENATGFSRGIRSPRCLVTKDPGDEVPVYVFPRDIAQLRNAYQDRAGTAGRSDPERSPGIDFSIKDPESGEDSVPIFSTTQTPLSQNSIVDSITGELRRNGTRIAFIAATNPLDSLFLTQLVRRNSPGTRVLVGSPNVLFVAAASREHLSGTLFLSSYPMFLKGAQWLDRMNLNAGPDVRQKFAGPELQGIYNVTVLLAYDLGALFDEPAAPIRKLPLHGYRRLQNDPGYPGLWLLTLTRSGFLALDLPDKQVEQGLFAINPVPYPPLKPLLDDPPPSSWFITAFLAIAAIFVCCILLLACNVFGWLQRPLWLVVTDQLRTRLMALFGACLSMSALVWILAFPVWRAVIVAACQGRIGEVEFAARLAWIVTVAGFIAPLLSLFLVRRQIITSLPLGQRPIAKWRQQDLVYAGITVALFLIVTVAWAVSCWCSTSAAFFFRYRALDLYSGASPASPLFILAIVFFGISLIYFKRYTDAGKIRPHLPLSRVHTWSELTELKRLGERIENTIMAPGQLPLRDWWIRLGICSSLVFTCTVVLAWSRGLDALEIWHYNGALLTAVVVLLFCLATGCYDLVRIWTNLSRLIDRIDLLSLDSALDRISKEWPPQPIWAFGRSVSREALTRQMLEELGQREEALLAEGRRNPWRAVSALAGQQRQQLSKRALANLIDGSTSSQHLKARQQFEGVSASIAATILEHDLRPVLGEPENGGQEEGGKFLNYSRGFVMLVLSRFLIYVVQQVRRIALCISLDLLMLILLFHSYDPQSPVLISRFLAVLFAAVSVVIFRVFAAMERNHTLSRIAVTNPGQLNSAFWLHLTALGGLPLLGLLAHLFPPISNFLFSWVAPSLQAAP